MRESGGKAAVKEDRRGKRMTANADIRQKVVPRYTVNADLASDAGLLQTRGMSMLGHVWQRILSSSTICRERSMPDYCIQGSSG